MMLTPSGSPAYTSPGTCLSVPLQSWEGPKEGLSLYPNRDLLPSSHYCTVWNQCIFINTPCVSKFSKFYLPGM